MSYTDNSSVCESGASCDRGSAGQLLPVGIIGVYLEVGTPLLVLTLYPNPEQLGADFPNTGTEPAE